MKHVFIINPAAGKKGTTAQLERLDRAVSASTGRTLRRGKREKWGDEPRRPAGLFHALSFLWP